MSTFLSGHNSGRNLTEDGAFACMPEQRTSVMVLPIAPRSLLRMTGSGAVQREILRQVAVLNDRLYMGIRAEQVMPGASAAKRPDAAHWKTVVVSSEPFCLLAAGACKCMLKQAGDSVLAGLCAGAACRLHDILAACHGTMQCAPEMQGNEK